MGLPHPAGPLLGREGDEAQLRALIAAHRLVTLRGPAGVGKTRLAVEVAQRSLGSLDGRVWFVSLDSLDSGVLLAETVVSAIGIRSTLSEPLVVLRSFLDEAPSLLVLDNCEHLADEVRVFVEELLGATHHLQVLVTSRQVLGGEGEASLALAGLDTSAHGASTTLFRAIAQKADPALGAGDAEEEVAEICRLVDGVPLAIELAAARVGAITPHQILDQMRGSIALLRRAGREPDRATSLEASIAASYALCSGTERSLWCAFSVFAGSFALEDAVALSGEDAPTTLDLVETLLGKSILVRDDDDRDARARYRLLYVLRRFGRERLAEDPERERLLLDAHARWFAAIAARVEIEWIGPRQQLLMEHAEVSLADIRTASEHAVASGDWVSAYLACVAGAPEVWWATGRIDEGRHWIGRVLPVMREASDPALHALLNAEAFALAKGDWDAADAFLAQAAELAADPALASAATQSRLAFGRAFRCQLAGRFEEAASIAAEGIESASGLPADDPVHFRLRQIIVYACNGMGDRARGRRQCEELVVLSKAAGEVYYRAFAQDFLALYAWTEGDLAEAAELSGAAMRISAWLPNRPENPDALLIAGFIAASHGQTERAATLFGAAAGTSRTYVTSTLLFVDAMDDADRTRAWRRRITEVLHPDATLRGYRMTPAQAVAFALTRGREEERPLLTPRELEVAALIVDGLINKEIAAALRISVRTAEGHVERIRKKLGVRSRVDIGTWYVRRTLGAPDAASS